jgi:hypothetical protein
MPRSHNNLCRESGRPPIDRDYDRRGDGYADSNNDQRSQYAGAGGYGVGPLSQDMGFSQNQMSQSMERMSVGGGYSQSQSQTQDMNSQDFATQQMRTQTQASSQGSRF